MTSAGGRRRDPAPAPPAEDDEDPGGPLVMVCVGHRCAALLELARERGSGPGLPGLAESVRATRGAMLVTMGCVGHCELGAVVGLGHRPPSSAAVETTPGGVVPFTGGVMLAGMDRAPRAEALRRWILDGGIEAAPPPEALARRRAHRAS